MKTTLPGTPCWVLSSHSHPCEAANPFLPADSLTRRASAQLTHRPRRRATQLAAYWMQVGPALPERPKAKRPANSLG